MTPFEPALDNRPLRNGPSSVTSNHNTHLGVLATTWYAVPIDANFMRWSGSKWRYLKVQWDETSSILHLERVFFLGHGSCLDTSCSESTSNFMTLGWLIDGLDVQSWSHSLCYPWSHILKHERHHHMSSNLVPLMCSSLLIYWPMVLMFGKSLLWCAKSLLERPLIICFIGSCIRQNNIVVLVSF